MQIQEEAYLTGFEVRKNHLHGKIVLAKRDQKRQAYNTPGHVRKLDIA